MFPAYSAFLCVSMIKFLCIPCVLCGVSMCFAECPILLYDVSMRFPADHVLPMVFSCFPVSPIPLYSVSHVFLYPLCPAIVFPSVFVCPPFSSMCLRVFFCALCVIYCVYIYFLYPLFLSIMFPCVRLCHLYRSKIFPVVPMYPLCFSIVLLYYLFSSMVFSCISLYLHSILYCVSMCFHVLHLLIYGVSM